MVIKTLEFELALFGESEFAAGCQLFGNIGDYNLPAFAF
jgi:hypothetical protein